MKHTPGPWKFHKQARTIAIYRSDNADTIANVPISAVVDNTRREHDARLIAAAPDLLEALIGCLECEFSVTDKAAINKARDAIAKATGETK